MTTTATRTHAAAARAAARTASVLPTGYVLTCGVCQVPGDAFATRAEAELLAGTHDGLHHFGRPTAQVTGGGICESCRSRRAVRAWHYAPAGAPFQLCADCRPTTDTDAPPGADPDMPAGQVIDLRDHTVPDDHDDDQDHDQADDGAGGDQVVAVTPAPGGGARW
jgi:hypothetical protein